MSRRKPLAKRDPCGRLTKVPADKHLLSPVQIRRMVDAASAEARDPLWATMVGRLHLNGKITASELAAATKWNGVVANYSQACRSPSPPRTVALDALGGTPIDPDSEQGEREVSRHERASAEWIQGRNALRLAGRDAERVVDDVCIKDQAPVGIDELATLQKGLQALSATWSERRKPAR